MPDNLDFEWLRWLVEHPTEWSDADLATAKMIVAWQTRAIEEEHPKDVRGRREKQELVHQLEAAIAAAERAG